MIIFIYIIICNSFSRLVLFFEQALTLTLTLTILNINQVTKGNQYKDQNFNSTSITLKGALHSIHSHTGLNLFNTIIEVLVEVNLDNASNMSGKLHVWSQCYEMWSNRYFGPNSCVTQFLHVYLLQGMRMMRNK